MLLNTITGCRLYGKTLPIVVTMKVKKICELLSIILVVLAWHVRYGWNMRIKQKKHTAKEVILKQVIWVVDLTYNESKFKKTHCT